jgi:hypothetical protein
MADAGLIDPGSDRIDSLVGVSLVPHNGVVCECGGHGGGVEVRVGVKIGLYRRR